MHNKLYIPKLCHVGYQERRDTYTGKLAYIIYTDDKGKKRKQTSWEGWCQRILPDFKNEPTEGFVINRNVGGVRSGWGSFDTRMEKVRVFDPRGWEFEITIPNLLFILQESSSMKGKGLVGTFVYAWSGTELVLLPTGCPEYIESIGFTDLQAMKVAKKDIGLGSIVTLKTGETAVYLGKQIPKREFVKSWLNYSIFCSTQPLRLAKPVDVYYEPSRDRFFSLKGATKIAKVGDKHPEASAYLDALLKTMAFADVWELEYLPVNPEEVTVDNLCDFGYAISNHNNKPINNHLLVKAGNSSTHLIRFFPNNGADCARHTNAANVFNSLHYLMQNNYNYMNNIYVHSCKDVSVSSLDLVVDLIKQGKLTLLLAQLNINGVKEIISDHKISYLMEV